MYILGSVTLYKPAETRYGSATSLRVSRSGSFSSYSYAFGIVQQICLLTRIGSAEACCCDIQR